MSCRAHVANDTHLHVQAIWALAKLRLTDKPTLDALVKATKGKTGALESPIDAAALAWSLGFLSESPASNWPQAPL